MADERPRHPKGLYVLFFTEMWERFGFYTMLFLFTLYLDEYFHFIHKGRIYGLYLWAVYLTPAVGGFIADRWLGFRKTIMIGAVLLACGYGLMSVKIPDSSDMMDPDVWRGASCCFWRWAFSWLATGCSNPTSP